ncbi:MAG: hypothetical protein KDA84_01265 [Planctomycetaceae bacterium]|nr:hypothetical protein [Planctomycetaceae bacterium]
MIDDRSPANREHTLFADASLHSKQIGRGEEPENRRRSPSRILPVAFPNLPFLNGRGLLGGLLVVSLFLGCGGAKPSPVGNNEKKTKLTQKSSKGQQPQPYLPTKNDSPPSVPAVIRLPSESPQPPRKTELKGSALVGRFQPDSPPFAKQAKPYRPSDSRPEHNAAALAELGIRRYDSKHLILYTDINPVIARDLPKLVDQLYLALDKYVGPLPPDRQGSTFQMTGYIMADKRVFRETGLLPEDLREFHHGRHRGAEFWMNDQEFDYYRRHLMLHEATHCFMTITKRQITLPPVWYMEGMAELFGTHRITGNGQAQFGVMPDDKNAFAGLGRITLVQTAIEKGRFRSLDQVFDLTANDYSENEAYAWSWAMCKFLDTHPRYRKRFREMGATETRLEFIKQFRDKFDSDLDELRTEWALFAHQLDEGYQIEPTAITFQSGTPLNSPTTPVVIALDADRGWQSSGVLIEQGKKYHLTARGQFTLAGQPKPWISEANGISFRYFQGQPLGKLVGCLQTDSGTTDPTAYSMRQVFACGSNHTFIAPKTGTLYLRLNDDWSQLQDNSGKIQVEIALE